MSITAAIYSKLSATTAITDIVGAEIWPNILPQDARGIEKLPAIMFEMVTNPQDHNMGTDDTPEHPTFSIHSYAQAYNTADNIRIQVITALKDFSGAVSGTSITFQRIFINDVYDQYISETGTHDLIVNVIAWANRLIV